MSETDIRYPKMYEYVVNTYAFMLKHKTSNEFEGKPVYRGHLTKDLENNLGITTSQYSRTIKSLVEMKCIYQVRRGAGAIPSEWALLTPPTFEEFENLRGDTNRMHRRKPDYLSQRVKDLSERVNRLERKVFGDG